MEAKILNNWYDNVMIGNLTNILRRYRFLTVAVFQVFSVILAYFASFCIRFDFNIPNDQVQLFYTTLPYLIVARMAGYYFHKIPSSSWRYASMKDLIDISKAVITGSGLFIILIALVYRFQGFPRSVFILEILFSIMIIGGTRLVVRYASEHEGLRGFHTTKNVLIVGAGRAGVLIVNEIRANKELGLQVVGFVDDDRYKKGSTIHGVEVLGNSEDIPSLVQQYAVDEVFVAIPSLGYKDVTRIMEIARGANVTTKALPGLGQLMIDDTFTNQLKDVACEDLLGRKTVKFSRESDLKLLAKEINGRSVLVTGAGGSIGAELCNQIAQFHPRNLIIYDRYENSLYHLELDLRRHFPELILTPIIGDIMDSDKISEVLRTNQVNLIYHAAAYKHVPLMEREPLEAVRNNVIGTRNLARMAIEHDVQKFVFISTDKAVNPANIMGLTKRAAELIIKGFSGNGTKFVSVRFGNVIGSNGSVIPIFKKQIAEGGPITVTDPEVTRYFMSIPEAVQLVLIAGAMGNENKIFLLDMGKPVKISKLAKELIRRSGMEPGRDIDIVFTGLRKGEKMHEELYWQGEGIVPTENKKITMLRANGVSLKNIISQTEVLEQHVARRDIGKIIGLLQELVPEATIAESEKRDGSQSIDRATGMSN